MSTAPATLIHSETEDRGDAAPIMWTGPDQVAGRVPAEGPASSGADVEQGTAMLQPIATLRRVPAEVRRYWLGLMTFARRLAGRRARPTREELLAMSTSEFEDFLEERGVAERVRKAQAEEATRH